MLRDLELIGHYKKDPEIWITHLIAEKVEEAFKKALKCDKVYYAYYECPTRLNPKIDCADAEHRLVWFGSGLLDFIRKCQKRPEVFCVIATSANTKGNVVDECPCEPFQWAHHDCPQNTYWIGDVGPWDYVSQYDNERHVTPGGWMVCGDDMWCLLWNRMRERAYGKKS